MYFYNEETENTLVDYNYWSMYNYCFTNLKNTVIIHKMRMFISKNIYIYYKSIALFDYKW